MFRNSDGEAHQEGSLDLTSWTPAGAMRSLRVPRWPSEWRKCPEHCTAPYAGQVGTGKAL